MAKMQLTEKLTDYALRISLITQLNAQLVKTIKTPKYARPTLSESVRCRGSHLFGAITRENNKPAENNSTPPPTENSNFTTLTQLQRVAFLRTAFKNLNLKNKRIIPSLVENSPKNTKNLTNINNPQPKLRKVLEH